MSKIERVILRLGNDSTTQRKLETINKVTSKEKSIWCWGESSCCAAERRKYLTPSEVSVLTNFLSVSPTKELYIVFNIKGKTVNGTIMDPDTELIAPSNYWITCTEHLSFEFAEWGTVGETLSKISERMSEYTISFDAAKDAMLSFSADTSAMKDCVEKLKKELSDEMHKNNFNL